jgi:hypothetical protein
MPKKKQPKQNLKKNPVVKKTRSPPIRGIKRQTTLFSSWGLKQKTQSLETGTHGPIVSTTFRLGTTTDDPSFILDDDDMIECFKLLDDKWVQETIDMFPEIFN